MISSLEALRKLTKVSNKSSDPIENFQIYLESKPASEVKLNSHQILRRGAGIGKILNVISGFYKKLQENYLKVWKFETIREELEYDKDYINCQVSYVLTYTFAKLNYSRIKTTSYAWFKWRDRMNKRSPVELLSVIYKKVLKHKQNQFNKFKLGIFTRKSYKSLKLTLVFSKLRKIIKSKLQTWQNRTHKAKIIENSFRDFQLISDSQSKASVVLSIIRKKLFTSLFKVLFLILSQKPPHQAIQKPSEPAKPSEKISIKKLKRQKEKHLQALTEANLKVQMVDMLLSLLSNSPK